MLHECKGHQFGSKTPAWYHHVARSEHGERNGGDDQLHGAAWASPCGAARQAPVRSAQDADQDYRAREVAEVRRTEVVEARPAVVHERLCREKCYLT